MTRTKRRSGLLSSTPTRRQWLGLAAATALARVVRAEDEPTAPPESPDDPDVRARARQVGINQLKTAASEHYLGIGDAPEGFQQAALKICEGLAGDYLAHFQAKRFQVAPPSRRLTVVILADARSFSAFLGEDLGEEVAGIYDLDANRLVMFDTRGSGRTRAERSNTVALLHEATHQLTFNTGLLARDGDIPPAISEGLATYAETRRPDGRTRIGAPNVDRVGVLALAARGGDAWLPLDRLLVEDALLEDPATAQMAYAESWLLVYDLLRSPRLLPRFRAYLDAIRPRRDASHRLDDARAALGDLDTLDRQLRAHALRLAGEQR